MLLEQSGANDANVIARRDEQSPFAIKKFNQAQQFSRKHAIQQTFQYDRQQQALFNLHFARTKGLKGNHRQIVDFAIAEAEQIVRERAQSHHENPIDRQYFSPEAIARLAED